VCADAVPSFSVVNTVHLSDVYNHWIQKQEYRDIYMFNSGEWPDNTRDPALTLSASTGSRIPKGHVFPLFVLLVIIVAMILLQKM
jgi:hypothetical protein